MKKRKSGDKGLNALQKSADKQGVRLQQANATRDMTDAAVMDRMVKKGLKGRDRMM